MTEEEFRQAFLSMTAEDQQRWTNDYFCFGTAFMKEVDGKYICVDPREVYETARAD